MVCDQLAKVVDHVTRNLLRLLSDPERQVLNREARLTVVNHVMPQFECLGRDDPVEASNQTEAPVGPLSR